MNLGFKTYIRENPTFFVEKIWECIHDRAYSIGYDYFDECLVRGFDVGWRNKYNPKRHTIRADKKDRWKAGNKIHFVIDHRTPDQFQFAPVVFVKSVQKIKIKWGEDEDGDLTVRVLIDGRSIGKEIVALAKNDGFDSVDDFFDWFSEDFTGKIIHWTDLKY